MALVPFDYRQIEYKLYNNFDCQMLAGPDIHLEMNSRWEAWDLQPRFCRRVDIPGAEITGRLSELEAMSSLSNFDIQKVEREYEKVRIHLAADLCRLNAVLPFALMLRRNEIDHIARELVQAVRTAPYRRQGPLLVRWVGAIRSRATDAVHRAERELHGHQGRNPNAKNKKTRARRDEPGEVYGDVPNMPFALPQYWAEADGIRAANSNRPRP